VAVPARAIPSAARKVLLACRRAPASAPFVFAEPAFEFVWLGVFVGVGVGVVDVLFVEFAVTARLFPMVDVVVHEDVGGAGWGGGVAGSPWKNVELPYTPIGSPESPRH